MPRRNHKTRHRRPKYTRTPMRCGECNVTARRDGSGKTILHHLWDCTMKVAKAVKR